MLVFLLLFLNKSFKSHLILFLSLAIFIILATIRYSPLLPYLDIFPLNLFRYWGRSSLIFLFCIGIFIPKIISLNLFEISFKRFYYLLIIFSYILACYIYSSNEYSNIYFVSNFFNMGIQGNVLNKVWLLIFLTTLLLLLTNIFLKKLYLLKVVLIFIIFDILFFSYSFLS